MTVSEICTDSRQVLALPLNSSVSAAIAGASTSPTSTVLLPVPSSEPALRSSQVIRNVPASNQLEYSERNDVLTALADLIVDDHLEGPLLANQLPPIGRPASAFYREQLPQKIQALIQPTHPHIPSTIPSTISSATLIPDVFAEDFRENRGWRTSKILYENIVAHIELSNFAHTFDDISQPLIKAFRDRLEKASEVIVRLLLGDPVNVKNSPLPKWVMAFFFYCDQRFHRKLMEGKRTQHLTTAQMHQARAELQQQLMMTYLLEPMLSGLAPRNSPQKQARFRSIILTRLNKALPTLQRDLFRLSFANAPKDFQNAVSEKYEQETQ